MMPKNENSKRAVSAACVLMCWLRSPAKAQGLLAANVRGPPSCSRKKSARSWCRDCANASWRIRTSPSCASSLAWRCAWISRCRTRSRNFAKGVRLAPDSFIAQLKMGELWMRLRVIEKAEEHTRQAALLAQNMAQSELARRQAATIRTYDAQRNQAWWFWL